MHEAVEFAFPAALCDRIPDRQDFSVATICDPNNAMLPFHFIPNPFFRT